jgi:phage-related protein
LDQDALDKLNLLNDAVDKMKATLTGAGSVFSTAFAGPLTEGISTITSYLERLGKAFTEGGLDGLSDELTTILSEVVGKIVEFMPTFIQLGIDLLGKIAIGIIQNIPTIVKAIPQIIGALVNALGGVGKELLNMGGSIIDGVWKGIAAKATQFTQKLKDFFGGIVKSVKNFLGINSPSTVFAGIGENMALGLTNGFSNEMASATNKINGSVPKQIDMSGSYRVNRIPQAKTNENINLTIQIDGQTLARQTYENFRKESKLRGTPLVQGV